MEATLISSAKSATKAVARNVLPRPLLNLAKRLRSQPGRQVPPPVGRLRFGDLRRLDPVSREFGYDRGRPIDRYYIENFLAANSRHIRGTVLEIGEDTYTRKFGSDVTTSEMLHVTEGFDATYVDDLAVGSTLPSGRFDCVILTQTLHLIYDMKAALATIYRILKPGGVLLATVPGISQTTDDEWQDTWYWSLTGRAARRLFAEVFPSEGVEVTQHGNVLAAASFLHGLADTELTRAELDFVDPSYPLSVTIKATAAHDGTRVAMVDRWDYAGKEPFPYDDQTSYHKGLGFLDGQGKIEDWGCGTAFARQFVATGDYFGIDGSASPHADLVTDLQDYRSDVDCIFMRHVLEHNWGWRSVLRNAVESFRRRMTLVVFTPFAERETKLLHHDGIPDLGLSKAELMSYFVGCSVKEERIRSATQYGEETIFYLEKQPSVA